MGIRIFLLSIILHFQANAQLGFDSYGMYYGDEHLEKLVLHFIQHKVSGFTLKVQRYEKGKLQDKYKCNYSVKDSILYQSCGSYQNQHRITGDHLEWISDFSDPEDSVYSFENTFVIQEDSANTNTRTLYRMRESDTIYTRITKSYFDAENRIKIQEITYGHANIQRKNEFEYFQNDSLAETNYEWINNQWVPIRKVITTLTPYHKTLTEYKPGQADPVSRATFVFKDKQIVKLIIDYNDQKKRTDLYNAQYVIEVEKVKFPTL